MIKTCLVCEKEFYVERYRINKVKFCCKKCYYIKKKELKGKLNPNWKRINLFKKYGYDTLVIWSSELRNLDKLKKKIIEFNKI